MGTSHKPSTTLLIGSNSDARRVTRPPNISIQHDNTCTSPFKDSHPASDCVREQRVSLLAKHTDNLSLAFIG